MANCFRNENFKILKIKNKEILITLLIDSWNIKIL